MKSLRKTFRNRLVILSSSLLLFFVSCGETGNYGYPSKVVFNNSGGDKEVKGTDSPYLIEIRDYDGNGAVSNPLGTAGDSMIVSYQWLTIKAKKRREQTSTHCRPQSVG